MQAFFAPVTAALLLIHAVLGCCWHPVQSACASEQSGSIVGHGNAGIVGHGIAGQGIAGQCCGHCGEGEHRDSAPEQPCDCRVECHGDCVYLSEMTSLDSPLSLASWDYLPEVSGEVAILAELEHAAAHPPLINIAPPLRLHLQNQILLI
jgi:hypothetical protein